MKRTLCLFAAVLLLLCGCTKQPEKVVTPKEHFIIAGNRTYVAPYGEVPADFQKAIDGGFFRNIIMCDGRLFKTDTLTDGYQIKMYDPEFRELASCVFDDIDHYVIHSALPTSDGGMLIAAGLTENYLPNNQEWNYDLGYRTQIVKYDASGKEEFRYSEDISWTLDSMYETDSCYLVFGTSDTPETRVSGMYSPTDVYLLSINKDGTFKDQRTLGGQNFDSLVFSERENENFLLYAHYQSENGVPKGSGYHKITVNERLEVLDDAILPNLSKPSVGTIDGEKQYDGKGIFEGYQDGNVLNVFDYGDFYLVISLHTTGTYENQPPQISSIWEYFEKVYSAYDKNGNVLWITTEDVSPDYDAMRELYNYE